MKRLIVSPLQSRPKSRLVVQLHCVKLYLNVKLLGLYSHLMVIINCLPLQFLQLDRNISSKNSTPTYYQYLEYKGFYKIFCNTKLFINNMKGDFRFISQLIYLPHEREQLSRFFIKFVYCKRKSGSKEITDYVDGNHDAENKSGL